MFLSHIILAILWSGYCALHSLFASQFFKTLMKKGMGNHFKFYRLYYTLFALVGFAGIIIYQVGIPSELIFKRTIFSQLAGAIVSLTGLVIMLVCIRKYFMQLSGLRNLIENRVSHTLLVSGIHKYVRHPLYAGTFLFIWGLFLFLPNWSIGIAVSIITVYTLIGIRLEENKLVTEFGDDYKNYQRKVPMLIPGFR